MSVNKNETNSNRLKEAPNTFIKNLKVLKENAKN